MRLSDQDLRRLSVIASDGIAVGELTAIFIDSSTWQVESLQVRLRKDIADRLGAERTIFHSGALEIPTHMIQSIGDAVILSVEIDELRRVIPGDPSEATPAH